MLIGWRFPRSRLLFTLLVLALADRTLLHFAAGHGLTRDRVVFQAIAVLLPLNFAALALTAERGFLTPPGLMRLGLILGQVALVSILDRATPGVTAPLLHSRLLPGWMFAWTPMADPALLAFFGAAGLPAPRQPPPAPPGGPPFRPGPVPRVLRA